MSGDRGTEGSETAAVENAPERGAREGEERERGPPGSDTGEPAVDAREAALATDDLSKSFGEVTAVDRVGLRVPQGELRAIIGPNGAGKTTLFNVVTGALPPTAGRVWLDGADVTETPQHARPHRGLARSFQSNELFTDRTVLENVRVVAQTADRGAFSLDLFRDARSVARDRALEIIDRVGFEAAVDTLARNLSHGDQRRLGIAMALATDPEVLLLDEPTSGMSPGATAETASLVEEIQQSMGLTVLLIEHDMDVVLSVSDRITVLDRGSVITTGRPEQVRENPDVQDAYLGGMREAI
jgi:branched-chain amino acid transport system ATP-binding protein